MRQSIITLCAAGLVGLAGAPASAQRAPGTPRHVAAQDAGFRALHLCTGYFATEAPRSLVESTADAISLQNPRVEVDEQARTVSVRFSDDMPPRIAVARRGLGCVMLPIGATDAKAPTLLRPALAAPNLDLQAWPMGDRAATAELAAARRSAVEAVIDATFKDDQGPYLGRSWGIVVVKDGKIVAERYQHGFSEHIAARTNSMCKSVGGSLIGVGVRKGLLDLQRKGVLAEWRRPGDPRGQITLDNLMHMASGLYVDGPQDPQVEVYRSGASAAEAGGLNMLDAQPGKRFVYSGVDTILAVRALRQAVNNDAAYPGFPYREFLWKLGMTRTVLETDWNNDFVVSGQCWSTARDFGRFGMLYLADGVWNGERILPAGWSRYVSTPAPAQPRKPSIGGEADYGAQFWLYGGMEGLPAGTYAAFGARGQYAVMIPSLNLVIVRRGLDRGSEFKVQRFAADIARAVSPP